MLSMSERLGNVLQLLDPAADDRRRVVRSRRRLGVELRGARTQLRVVEPLDGPVVERGVRDARLVTGRDRKAVVLRGDEYAAGPVVEDRVVRTAVAERELERLLAGREREQLVAQAHTEHRRAAEQL